MTHILVVEDERHLALGIQFNLQAEGYQVSVAQTGMEALNIVRRAAPPVDLVVLDLMLPGMSGYAVCEQLRAAGQEMPVLILSARTLTEDRTRGFEVGADQYLTKPFELDELLVRIRSLLNRQAGRTTGSTDSATPARSYRLGQSTIDFDSFEAQIAGETKTLTPLEIKLLQYLIDNPGRVISRQELLEKVWQQPGYLQTRAVDQFIRRLRKLFEPDPSVPRYFLTVRDAGYRFVPESSDPETERAGD